jgi:Mce-associated membrane protein
VTEAQAPHAAAVPDGDRAAAGPATARPGLLARLGSYPAAIWRQAAAPWIAAALLLGFTVVALTQAGSRHASGDGNVAITDAAATAQVRQQVSHAISTVFSYSYADPAATRAAAQRLLTGAAIRQYDSIFAVVQKQAPAQQLVLTTKVTSIGVEFLTGARARLLIFVSQQDRRAGTGAADYSGAMLAVNAVLRGGRWRIDDVDTFTSAGS